VQLTEADVSGTLALSSIAGWNQTHEDWGLLLELSDACFGIRVDGQVVATATLVCYGHTLAWLGMVLTHPEFRRMGLARTLVAHVMEHARALGIQTAKLDATDEGRHLYESFGLRPEQQVERWQRRRLSGAPAVSGCVTASAPGFDLDAKACGYDRKQLLERLSASGDAVFESGGYALSRPGRLNRYLGPCVAVSQTAARSLIEETIARHPDTGWFWDLLPANDSAVALARELGFECVRKLTRMSWGREIRGKEEGIFAIAGLELG
jgi:GNAT superfamily N-acetyltransferase